MLNQRPIRTWRKKLNPTGVDGQLKQTKMPKILVSDLEKDLLGRLKKRSYKGPPGRSHYIPKVLKKSTSPDWDTNIRGSEWHRELSDS